MKDVFGLVLPLFWNYCANLLLMISNPFAILSARTEDSRYFKDSILFLGVSALLASLLSAVIAGPASLEYVSITISAASLFVTVFFASLSFHISWWAFGYRDRAIKIMTPFIYSLSAFFFIDSILNVLANGIGRLFSVEFSKYVNDVVSSCKSIGVLSSFGVGVEAGRNMQSETAAIAIMSVASLLEVFFLIAFIVGAFRTAFKVHRLRSELWNATLVVTSIVPLAISLILSEAVSQTLVNAISACPAE